MSDVVDLSLDQSPGSEKKTLPANNNCSSGSVTPKAQLLTLSLSGSQLLVVDTQQKHFGTPKCPRDCEKRSEYRCQSFFICFIRSGLPSCLCFVCSGLPSHFQNCTGTPKNSRQIFCLSRQRRLLLGTVQKLKTKRILTRLMCFFMKGLLATITSDQTHYTKNYPLER